MTPWLYDNLVPLANFVMLLIILTLVVWHIWRNSE